MRTAYIPKEPDFRRLQKYADKQRTIYNGHFLDLRNKFVAHRERVDLTAVFANANIRRLGRLLVFLDQLQDALWQLFVNGRKPVLRPARYSGKRILKSPLLISGIGTFPPTLIAFDLNLKLVEVTQLPGRTKVKRTNQLQNIRTDATR